MALGNLSLGGASDAPLGGLKVRLILLNAEEFATQVTRNFARGADAHEAIEDRVAFDTTDLHQVTDDGLGLLGGVQRVLLTIDKSFVAAADRRLDEVVHLVLALPVEGVLFALGKEKNVFYAAAKVGLDDLGAGVRFVPHDRSSHI